MATNLHRVNIHMSQGGRDGRDQHHVSFLAKPEAAYSRNNAGSFCNAIAAALAGCTLAQTAFLSAAYSQVDRYGKVVPGTSFSVPLDMVGAFALPGGSAVAREQVALAIRKGADYGKPGISYLRHCITTDEDAAYVETGAIPARFTANLDGGDFAGMTLGEALAAAADVAGYVYHLPSTYSALGVETNRVVTAIAANEFRSIKATRHRKSVERDLADAVQRKLNDMARKAWKLFEEAGGIGGVPALLAIVGTIIAEINAEYAALPALEAAEVVLPLLPALL